ncbi:rhodopsin-like [Spodoptera litura]|uniref:Rhodopsin-like n=1 Tax=Spodoptera litura TaxID=69820 RepID=A0A9J7IQ97_SPOLT|nr:rhodopsin-like [Spodoptera litura]
MADACVWKDVFTNDERIVLQQGYLITGLLSVIFSFWLSVTLLFTNLRYDDSYLNMGNFIVVACTRRIVPMFLHLPFVNYIETLYGFQIFSCELFAFVETFLAVFEVECLTHVCIERYVVSKYIANGWQIQKKHYYLFTCLCLFFSCLYSIPPLFGFGKYGHDLDCTSFTFDMVLPETWQRYSIVTIFLLRSVKPAIVMIMTVVWARVLERKFPCCVKNQHITRSVLVITIVNLLCWTPIAMIRGYVVSYFFVHMDVPRLPSTVYITWALWIHWVAPALTAIALLLVDDRVRNKMFNLQDYGVENDNKRN